MSDMARLVLAAARASKSTYTAHFKVGELEQLEETIQLLGAGPIRRKTLELKAAGKKGRKLISQMVRFYEPDAPSPLPLSADGDASIAEGEIPDPEVENGPFGGDKLPLRSEKETGAENSIEPASLGPAAADALALRPTAESSDLRKAPSGYQIEGASTESATPRRNSWETPALVLVLNIARETADDNTTRLITFREEAVLRPFERQYGTEIIQAKATELKESGEKGAKLIRHLASYLTEYAAKRAQDNEEDPHASETT